VKGILSSGQPSVPWVKPTWGGWFWKLPLSRRKQNFLPGMPGMRCLLALRKRSIHFTEKQMLGHHLVPAGSCQLKY